MQRYTVKEIIKLNNKTLEDDTRECSICKRSHKLKEDDICEPCSNLNEISNEIKRKSFLAIRDIKPDKRHIELPFEKYLTMEDENSLREILEESFFIRAYSKNNSYAGYKVATKVWIGDYNKKGDDIELTIEDLAKESLGVERIGVLRADVDNLGQAFISGFQRNGDNKNKYTTLTRTGTLSKRLSTFFKLHINEILEKGEFFIEERDDKSRNAIIVYSGGDDLFILGSWDDLIGIAIDINNKFAKYNQNTLTISAGIGLYGYSYPISSMARETGLLEAFSKKREGKNAITLFDAKEEFRFDWKQLEDNVLGEKYKAIEGLIGKSGERGNSTLYKILELLRSEESINIARLAYQLARLEPYNITDEFKENTKKIFSWVRNKEDKKELIMAIYIYVYGNRGR